MFYSIPQGHAAVLERWGKFDTVLEAGFNYHNPFMRSFRELHSWGNIANKDGWLIELADQHQETRSRVCQTHDNVSVKAGASIYWRIVDPEKAVYAVDSLPQAVNDLALNVLRSQIGTMKLDEVFSRRTEINDALREAMLEHATRWGIEFRGIEIRELSYADEIAQTMMKGMIAEKEKLAAITTAEGNAQAVIKEAQAKAEVARIEATADAETSEIRVKAEAKNRRILASADADRLEALIYKVGREGAIRLMLANKTHETLKAISADPNSKVYIPHNVQTILDRE